MKKSVTCCPICQSTDFDIIADGIGKCHVCQHGFRVSVEEEVLPHYYSTQYWHQDKNQARRILESLGEWSFAHFEPFWLVAT